MSKLAAALVIALLAPGLLLVAAVVVRVLLKGFRDSGTGNAPAHEDEPPSGSEPPRQ